MVQGLKEDNKQKGSDHIEHERFPELKGRFEESADENGIEESEEEEDELDYFSRLKETFPDAYEKFSEYCIDTEMENFDPDYYIDG